MADDDSICGCGVLLVILYAIYSGITWVIDKYSWEPLAIVFSTAVMVIVAIYARNKMWSEACTVTEEGKVFIKFGIIWFVSIFIISCLVDLWFIYSQNNGWQKGAGIFFITMLVNMPGTFILFYIGAKKLKSKGSMEEKVKNGRNILYFGMFWIIFWIIVPIVLMSLTTKNDTAMFILFIGLPGMVGDTIISMWASRIDVQKGWEILNDAQKKLDVQKEWLTREKKEFQEARRQFIQQQQETLKKYEDTKKIKKEIDVQQKDIRKARENLKTTWDELENILENPFTFLLNKKLNKAIFIEEIKTLKKTRPGDISSIDTCVDSTILELKEKLKDEIVKVEDENYYNAFLEYFKNNGHDPSEYDRIRTRYNPTIHTKSDRRNKEWAEKRRFELSRIERLLKE